VARRVDVAKRAAATGDNLEQAGRVVRYEAANGLLDELCAQRGCPPEAGRIATAHTLDDRAETFLMRTIVGGGTGSLASIPYRNGRVIRPLLSCTRSELRTWLQSKRPAPQWREDASNADTAHLRAFVRHEVIPLLKTRNPDLLHTLADSMDALAGDERHLAAKAAQAAARHLHVDDIPPAPLATLDAVALEEPPAIARRVVRMACQRVMPPGARLTFEHVDAIVNCGAHVGFATDIPGDVTVRNVYGTLVFRRKTVDERPAHKGSC
jgi:tRNA(Ile)-lysidine synthase